MRLARCHVIATLLSPDATLGVEGPTVMSALIVDRKKWLVLFSSKYFTRLSVSLAVSFECHMSAFVAKSYFLFVFVWEEI